MMYEWRPKSFTSTYLKQPCFHLNRYQSLVIYVTLYAVYRQLSLNVFYHFIYDLHINFVGMQPIPSQCHQSSTYLFTTSGKRKWPSRRLYHKMFLCICHPSSIICANAYLRFAIFFYVSVRHIYINNDVFVGEIILCE